MSLGGCGPLQRLSVDLKLELPPSLFQHTHTHILVFNFWVCQFFVTVPRLNGCEMLVPRPGIDPAFPALKSRLLTPAPPGEPQHVHWLPVRAACFVKCYCYKSTMEFFLYIQTSFS